MIEERSSDIFVWLELKDATANAA